MSPRATIVDYWSDFQSSYPPRIWRVNTNLEDSVVGSLVGMDSLELLDWDLHIAEASRGEVRGLELRKCLRVELCLELLEDVRELCKRATSASPRMTFSKSAHSKPEDRWHSPSA